MRAPTNHNINIIVGDDVPLTFVLFNGRFVNRPYEYFLNHPYKSKFIDVFGWKQRKKKPIARLLFSIIEGFIEEGYVLTRVAALSLSTAK